jgi:hypothetical protein
VTTRRSIVRLSFPLLILAAGCQTPRDPVTDDQFRPGLVPIEWDTGTVGPDGRRVTIECPNISPVDLQGTGSRAFHDTTVAMPLAGEVQQIPEYHDCQRLMTRSSPHHFGPLVGIFAREALGAITAEQFQQPAGVPVGQIYNFSSMPYGPLGIRPRYNCLYLRMEADGTWKARMEWRDGDARCPALSPDAWQGGGPLVVRSESPVPESAHYPPVARWDRDPDNNLHYIGIKCLDAWCEIGVAGFASSKKHSRPDYLGQVKGWYDEQNLAEIPRNERKAMVPGVRGSIVPEPRLDTLLTRHFTCAFPCPDTAGWVHMATTWLEGPSSTYETRLNFKPGTNGNTIHLRRHLKTSGEERWESRIISADGDTTYHRTLRVDHSPSGPGPHPLVPATARWHWRENDETTWTRCDVGCCETTDQRIDLTAW